MKVGFYAGSFDPFTIGHLHLVKKASELFDKVIIGMGVNPKKVRSFDKEEMKNAINELFKNEGLNNCECIVYEGLTVDAAKKYDTTYLIRGIRNGMDYDFEENLALVNEEISGLDTIYIRAGSYGAVSSSMVKELLANNKEAKKYLPEEIFKLIK